MQIDLLVLFSFLCLVLRSCGCAFFPPPSLSRHGLVFAFPQAAAHRPHELRVAGRVLPGASKYSVVPVHEGWLDGLTRSLDGGSSPS